MEPLGQRIRRLRERRNLSLPQLAGYAGRGPRWLYNVEHDLTDLDRREIEGLAHGLRVNVGVLIGSELTSSAGLPERGERPTQTAKMAPVADLIDWLARAADPAPEESHRRID